MLDAVTRKTLTVPGTAAILRFRRGWWTGRARGNAPPSCRTRRA
jgi:hypothetical protein